jgi:hypothetical protein
MTSTAVAAMSCRSSGSCFRAAKVGGRTVRYSTSRHCRQGARQDQDRQARQGQHRQGARQGQHRRGMRTAAAASAASMHPCFGMTKAPTSVATALAATVTVLVPAAVTQQRGIVSAST